VTSPIIASLRGEQPQFELDDLRELAGRRRLRGLGMCERGIRRLMGEVGDEIREERLLIVQRRDSLAAVGHDCTEKYEVGRGQRAAVYRNDRRTSLGVRHDGAAVRVMHDTPCS
jgi:hypothetical protein